MIYFLKMDSTEKQLTELVEEFTDPERSESRPRIRLFRNSVFCSFCLLETL